MKKFLLSLLVIILALGLLGAVGYAGYRYGFTQGMVVASNGAKATNNNRSVPPGFGIGPRRMPLQEFGFQRGFNRNGFGMMGRARFGFGFGALPLIGLLARLLFWGLIAAGIVWLVTRSGWRLTRNAPVAAAPVAPAPPAETPPPASDEETPQA